MQSNDTAPEDAVRIPLRARDGSIRAYALVDTNDAEWINQWRWSLNSEGYARRGMSINGRQITIRLHRAILGLVDGDGFEGDHIDRNPLNCRRSNLRAVPYIGRANQQNKRSAQGSTSGFRGVCWDRVQGKWKAKVKINGKTINLGRFTDELEAAEVARAARLRLMPYAVD